MAGDSALSLAETNKVRESLGLAPLAGEEEDNDGQGQEEAEMSDDPDTIAEKNFAAKRAEERRSREEKETKERLARAKNQRELRAKLQGKGLGEAEEGGEKGSAGGGAAKDEGALAWVKQSRKKAKERAAELARLKQREKELEERDREALYGEEDLAGLKVAHGAEDFEEGKDVILTLADRKVLDDEDDELQNVNLAEYRRTAQRLDTQKRGKTAYAYTGFDDEEFADSSKAGRARGVLSKYDEVIGEEHRNDGEGFRLGSISKAAPSTKAAVAEDGIQQRELNRDLLTLDYAKAEANDYLQEGDVGFKKPKKKKKSGKSSTRRAMIDDDSIDTLATGQASTSQLDTEMQDAEEEDQKPKLSTVERRLAKEGGGEGSGAVVDDDDLQAALARQRRAANKKRIHILKGEDIARQILEERASSMPVDGTDSPQVKAEEDEDQPADAEEEGGLVLDDTSEFIRNISARQATATAAARRENGSATPMNGQPGPGKGKEREVRVKSEPRDEEDGGVPLTELEVKQEEPEEGETFSDEEDEGKMSIDRADRTRSMSADVKAGFARVKEEGSQAPQEEDGPTFGTTAEEKLVSGGLVSTLSILRQSGLIKKQTPEEIERERASKERERFIQEVRLREMERELERMKSKAAGSSKDQAQRELDNKRRQYEEAQRTLEAFKNYKPNVEIKYHDEFGRAMTPKEAWKDLSHKFHGKGSGTFKREKLLKKVEEERKREAMSSGDTPLSTNAAFQARQERTGSATMVLGVGNKNTAPQADQFLGTSGKGGMSISKNKAGTANGAGQKRKREPKVLG